MTQIIFITGIDTDIGKTYTTGFYARHLMNKGHSVITQKFVQTGCSAIADDIITHRRLQGIELTQADQNGTTCPYVLDYPCSPHLAAKMAGIAINIEHITSCTKQLARAYDYILIEGAGGLCVPYDDRHTTLDYIASQGYPVILVSSGKLGSISPTLMSLMLCQIWRVPVLAVCYNNYGIKDTTISDDTCHYLKRYLARHHPTCQLWQMNEDGLSGVD